MDKAVKEKKFKLPKIKKPKHPVRSIALIVAIAFAGRYAYTVLNPAQSAADITFIESVAEIRDIQNTLTGTGTLMPINEYSVTTLARGEVLTDTFEEDDYVEEGQILYTIDSSDVEQTIEKNQISLAQSQLSYNSVLEDLANLTIEASKSGAIVEVNVEVGDDVSNGTVIATIRDSATMVLTVPFNSADAQTFSIGQTATVTLDSSFETLTGTVSEIDGVDTVLTGNQVIRYVTINVSNPGALSQSSIASANINGIACTTGGTFDYNAETDITAETSGEVVSLSISVGSLVSKNQVVCVLSNTSTENQVTNSALSLQTTQLTLDNSIEELEDYTITSPISGTVVTKEIQAGDNIDSTSSVSSLALIYDLSALKFELSLDELDANTVAVGQEVEISVDALDGEIFTGYITKISVAGTTANGATTYPVTVELTEFSDDLLPGMNIDASIIIEESAGAVSVPIGAVQRGDVVYIKDDGTSTASKETEESEEGAGARAGGGTVSEVPDGYIAVPVVTGISDGTYIEILSGISEGDTVYIPQTVSVSSSTDEMSMMMPGMDSGMSSGMPSGMSGGPESSGMPGGMGGR